MIWFQFLLNIIVHSAMAVLTIMTDCTAMSQCARGAVHDSHSVIGCCYLCIAQIADFVKMVFFAKIAYKIGYLCKLAYFCRLQEYLFQCKRGCYVCKIAYFSIAQITNFAKIGYFAQMAYLIGYQCKITFRMFANSNPIMQWWLPSATPATSQYSKHHDCTEIINIKSE